MVFLENEAGGMRTGREMEGVEGRRSSVELG